MLPYPEYIQNLQCSFIKPERFLLSLSANRKQSRQTKLFCSDANLLRLGKVMDQCLIYALVSEEMNGTYRVFTDDGKQDDELVDLTARSNINHFLNPSRFMNSATW